MELGVSRYSDELRSLFHGVKELVVVILVAGLTFSRPNITLTTTKHNNNKHLTDSYIHRDLQRLQKLSLNGQDHILSSQ